jgi:hypothetical protein
MKALPIVTLALALAAAGCGDSDSTPTPPTNNPPPAQNNTTTTTTYNLNLKTGNERPNAVSGAEAAATGSAIIKINITRDPAFNIVSANVEFDVSVSGFPAGSQVNIAHIHPGDQNTTGSISVNTNLVAGELQLTNGAGSFRKTTNNVDGAVAQSIVSNPAGFYFNVHSTANPGGVLRAQMDNTGVAGSGEPGQPKPCDPADPYCVPGQAS